MPLLLIPPVLKLPLSTEIKGFNLKKKRKEKKTLSVTGGILFRDPETLSTVRVRPP
jgi:hypothetical protein